MKKLLAVSILLLGAAWYRSDSTRLEAADPLQFSTTLSTNGDTGDLQVILLGTGGGPGPNPQRFGISTLIVPDQRHSCSTAAAPPRSA